jgi:hypothetical protein
MITLLGSQSDESLRDIFCGADSPKEFIAVRTISDRKKSNYETA